MDLPCHHGVPNKSGLDRRVGVCLGRVWLVVGSFRLQGVWRTVREESVVSPFVTKGLRVGLKRSVFLGVLLVVRG
jgi:hypothetical protein